MERVLEPELMEEPAQVLAYAEADFDEPNSHFVLLFKEFVNNPNFSGSILDLGCGPGDIAMRIAKLYPTSVIHAVDGSTAMLDYAKNALQRRTGIASRITFIHGKVPNLTLPHTKYDAIVSNSLLHHLPNPQALWSTIKSYAHDTAIVFIMDLLRPASINDATVLVDTHAAGEPEILQRDFYNSLLAAFTVDEIKAQLNTATLKEFRVRQVSDRHVVISGRIGPSSNNQ